MDFPESTTHSFIIRLWLEDDPDHPGRMIWGGHITHVPSGRRQHVNDLRQISRFIAPYLRGTGVSGAERVRRWLNRRR